MLDRDRIARRKFELSQKINDNAKLLGGLVHYLSYLVAGEWVALKQPRREGSRKLTADYLRHLTAARRVLRLHARKRFPPDGGSHCEYKLSLFYETHLYAATGLNLDDRWTRADFDSLPCGFKLSDLREFSDEHPELLERAKAFLAKDFLQSARLPRPSRLPAPTLSPSVSCDVTQTDYEQHKREAWLNHNFGIEL
jgi:hypothetical protein